MNSWRWLAFGLLILGIHSFASDYSYQRYAADGVFLIYVDLIRDFVLLAFALSGQIVALFVYGLYLLFFSLIPTLSYVPNYPYLGALIKPEYMPVIKAAVSLIYAFFFYSLGKEILSLVRSRSWGVGISKGNNSWLEFCAKKAWVVLFPLAYVVEMYSYRGLFEDYLLSVFGIWPVVLIGGFMLCVFAGIRLFFLLSAIALIGTMVNLALLIVTYEVQITDWPQLVFRLGLPLLASVSLFVEWRENA